jgi:hypothetical protein
VSEAHERPLPIQHSYLIPLLPLLGAVIAGFFCALAEGELALADLDRRGSDQRGACRSAAAGAQHHGGEGAASKSSRGRATGASPTLGRQELVHLDRGRRASRSTGATSSTR